jgi:hypothetical protein
MKPVRSRAIAVPFVAAVVACHLAGCSHSADESEQCIEQETEVVVSDWHCEDGDYGYIWYYGGDRSNRVGSKATGGSTSETRRGGIGSSGDSGGSTSSGSSSSGDGFSSGGS